MPLNCEVKFADFLPGTEIKKRISNAALPDFVNLDYIMSIEEPNLVEDESLDFVIAGHVIEHLRNPLRAFEQVYRKLKKGGQFVLVVPEKTRTYDRERHLTTTEHLILDYENPDRQRDKAHFLDFLAKVYNVPGHELEHRAEYENSSNGDIHFHVWTHDTFAELVAYSRQRISPWKAVWSQPSIDEHPESIEFYYTLEK